MRTLVLMPMKLCGVIVRQVLPPQENIRECGFRYIGVKSRDDREIVVRIRQERVSRSAIRERAAAR